MHGSALEVARTWHEARQRMRFNQFLEQFFGKVRAMRKPENTPVWHHGGRGREMSDVSQGPGWWQASDGKWYPPDIASAPLPPPPSSSLPAPDTASSPQGVPAPGPDPAATSVPLSRMTTLRWVIFGSLIGSALGLLLAWATATIIVTISVTGLNTRDGKLFAVVLAIAALLTLWRTMRTNRLNGCLLFIAWLGLLALAIYEIAHISSSNVVVVGSGLYVDAAAAAVGIVTATMDTIRHWSRAEPGQASSPLSTQWWPWAVAVVAVAAVVGSGIAGSSQKVPTITGNAGTIPATAPTGNTENTGTANTGTSPTTATTATTAPAGGTGNTGTTPTTATTATTAPAGGGTGNTGTGNTG